MTAELTSGQEEAVDLRKQLNSMCDSFQDRINKLQATLQQWRAKSGTSHDFSVVAKDASAAVPWRSRTISTAEQQDLNSSADEVIAVDDNSTAPAFGYDACSRPSSPSRKMSEAKRFDGYYNPEGHRMQVANPLERQGPVPVNNTYQFDYEEADVNTIQSAELAYLGRQIFTQYWQQDY